MIPSHWESAAQPSYRLPQVLSTQLQVEGQESVEQSGMLAVATAPTTAKVNFIATDLAKMNLT